MSLQNQKVTWRCLETKENKDSWGTRQPTCLVLFPPNFSPQFFPLLVGFLPSIFSHGYHHIFLPLNCCSSEGRVKKVMDCSLHVLLNTFCCDNCRKPTFQRKLRSSRRLKISEREVSSSMNHFKHNIQSCRM